MNFDLDAVPDDYTTQQPPSMDKVKENLALLHEVKTEKIIELADFVDRVTEEVYVVLNALKEEMRYVLAGEWKSYPFLASSCPIFEEKRDSLQKDLEYLEEMSKMDEEIKQMRTEGKMDPKPIEMTSVVPVSGLVLARFHVHSTEHSTAIDLWCPPESIVDPEDPDSSESSSTGSATICSFVTFEESSSERTDLGSSSADFASDSMNSESFASNQKIEATSGGGEGFLAFIGSSLSTQNENEKEEDNKEKEEEFEYVKVEEQKEERGVDEREGGEESEKAEAKEGDKGENRDEGGREEEDGKQEEKQERERRIMSDGGEWVKRPAPLLRTNSTLVKLSKGSGGIASRRYQPTLSRLANLKRGREGVLQNSNPSSGRIRSDFSPSSPPNPSPLRKSPSPSPLRKSPSPSPLRKSPTPWTPHSPPSSPRSSSPRPVPFGVVASSASTPLLSISSVSNQSLSPFSFSSSLTLSPPSSPRSPLPTFPPSAASPPNTLPVFPPRGASGENIGRTRGASAGPSTSARENDGDESPPSPRTSSLPTFPPPASPPNTLPVFPPRASGGENSSVDGMSLKKKGGSAIDRSMSPHSLSPPVFPPRSGESSGELSRKRAGSSSAMGESEATNEVKKVWGFGGGIKSESKERLEKRGSLEKSPRAKSQREIGSGELSPQMERRNRVSKSPTPLSPKKPPRKRS
eukprot:CAMPEP_0201539446 /NCGR_PEP_ID=MMETSP0161_2-20130828/70411_1 /ASSEMBLY_ACC=CAM_ASM_000251 /TAXON_ID=180227 /ORGANISM="Neoparamoeba aestuarina, Strain SoJaBio B1-5/56/2" /LENGTH=690 /DNA_ID=CAMNT_0047946843 /DNA_START=103 /DNA_END=2175 /DNA_ORIENTATION=+